MPDESTVRKLTRRIGPKTVSGLTRTLITTVTRENQLRPARPKGSRQNLRK